MRGRKRHVACRALTEHRHSARPFCPSESPCAGCHRLHGCLALATSLLVALAALGARSWYWRIVSPSGTGEARAPSFLSRLQAFATERVRSLPSPQDRADGFVGSSALFGSTEWQLEWRAKRRPSRPSELRPERWARRRLGGVLGKRRSPGRSPHGRVVRRTLGEPRHQPFGWQRARRRARRPARRPARAVLSAADPSAAAASRRISLAASMRPSALSAGVFREGWAAACPAA